MRLASAMLDSVRYRSRLIVRFQLFADNRAQSGHHLHQLPSTFILNNRKLQLIMLNTPPLKINEITYLLKHKIGLIKIIGFIVKVTEIGKFTVLRGQFETSDLFLQRIYLILDGLVPDLRFSRSLPLRIEQQVLKELSSPA